MPNRRNQVALNRGAAGVLATTLNYAARAAAPMIARGAEAGASAARDAATRMVKKVVRSLSKKRKKQPKQPQLQQQQTPILRAPRTRARGQRSSDGMTISRREYMGELQGNTNPTVFINALRVTPTNPAFLPWLSSISNGFEEYSFSKLTLSFVPSIGASSTGAIGSVITALQLDPEDIYDQPSDLQALMGLNQATSHAANAAWTVDLLRTKRGLWYFTQENPLNEDIRESVLSILFIGVVNTPLATSIGQLFVDYTVRLLGPRQTASGQTAHYKSESASVVKPLGSAPFVRQYGDDLVRKVSDATLGFNTSGVFMMCFTWAASSTPGTIATPGITNGDLLLRFSDPGSHDIAQFASTVGNPHTILLCMVRVNHNSILGISGLSGLTGGIFDLYIFSVNPSFSAKPPDPMAKIRDQLDHLENLFYQRRILATSSSTGSLSGLEKSE
jgi:hypothetical protein